MDIENVDITCLFKEERVRGIFSESRFSDKDAKSLIIHVLYLWFVKYFLHIIFNFFFALTLFSKLTFSTLNIHRAVL
jgi:hypothetical protein